MQRLMVRKEKALSETSRSFKNGVTMPKVNSNRMVRNPNRIWFCTFRVWEEFLKKKNFNVMETTVSQSWSDYELRGCRVRTYCLNCRRMVKETWAIEAVVAQSKGEKSKRFYLLKGKNQEMYTPKVQGENVIDGARSIRRKT